ncbi:MFS general substrate transporter [Lentinus tigrinus ALCF2SS1-7]|uniref:MFS general substrate transporter n=1 Tax=Lentinus tigrinus ALCF2SS1-6 TaxID=1328759 RepID=A0A5C2S4H8_9APHY|nr:MFS general substrate transporter [Lentinus tigrinus ALCF2SS1-6]RPD72809.1 MFS general substrate transporter [Lentinus tigrinus ALCF2SS1-7]
MDSSPPMQNASAADPPAGYRKGSAFWLSFLAIIVCTFVSALDVTAISTALPTITKDLGGGDKYVWVGAAYGLACTTILPLSGRFADAFGRRPVMLSAVAIFMLGSALSGATQNMNMLIAGRTVQGIGGGAILNLSDIIISDLIPLSQRGMYMGFFGLTWALASGVGPPIGGALAQASAWRWIFYLNLPLIGLAFTLVLLFLRVKTPSGSLREKLSRIDAFGNVFIIAGTTLVLIGLNWGGTRYPWADAHVLATLIIGFVLIGIFFLYEWRIPKDASIPWQVVSNRTTVAAYICTFVHGLASTAVFFYLPVYFQACLDASPLRSSVDLLPTTLIISPFAMGAGISVQLFQKYRWVNYLVWVFMMIGYGLLSTLREDSSIGKWVGYEIVVSAGIGLGFTATVFPVLAPLPVSRTAAALAFFAFSRTFAQTWGVTIGSTILQNRLNKTLPPQFNALFPDGVEIAYAAIPVIKTLEEPLRTEVRRAFAESLAVIWQTMIGICGIGLLSSLMMREVPMRKTADDTYGLDDSREKRRTQNEEGSEHGQDTAVEAVKENKSDSQDT